MEFNVQIDFQILDTKISPRDISSFTGITPEVQLEKGERNSKLTLPRVNVWSIRSHAKSNILADHWFDIAETLEAAREVIKDVSRTGKAKFTLIVNSSKRIPSLKIPPEMSRFAGYINAEIDIDHYS
ncbi:DUF4279 domain-containing protein [Microbulbifer sp. SSSA002]|uniref:DUF4279 domain-containing protein n=1 Tax=Microbulbifer sp. SSSA002 TaxID=3243376 RepID=UPI004039F41F